MTTNPASPNAPANDRVVSFSPHHAWSSRIPEPCPFDGAARYARLPSSSSIHSRTPRPPVDRPATVGVRLRAAGDHRRVELLLERVARLVDDIGARVRARDLGVGDVHLHVA